MKAMVREEHGIRTPSSEKSGVSFWATGECTTGQLNLAYGDSTNKCDGKNASGEALGSDTCHDSVRNPGEKHGSFEKRANGAPASPLARTGAEALDQTRTERAGDGRRDLLKASAGPSSTLRHGGPRACRGEEAVL